MFPSPALQSDAVKYRHDLIKQLLMHCVKKNHVLARLPGISAIRVKIIEVITSNFRKFPENLRKY